MRDTVILLATFNGEKYLRQQLDSIFAQTYQAFRLVVHDDGSTDDTVSIINEYRDRYPDKIEIFHGRPCGSAKENFLWMLKRVEADYYFLCDQDDVWFEDKLKRSIEAVEEVYMESKEEAMPVCAFSDMKVVDEDLQLISESFIRYIGRLPKNTAYTQILIDNPAAGCAMCFNKPLRDLVVAAVDDMDIENIPMHDALILEIAAIMGRVVSIDKPLALYRQTGHNTMGATTETDTDKANRNFADLKAGSLFAKKRAFMNEARLFAGEVAKAEFLPKDKKNILIRFANIGKKSKIRRVSFYLRNNFSRARHNLWFLLWV